MACVNVRLRERSYPILVGRDLLSSAGRWLRSRGLGRQVLVVTQKEIALTHQERLGQSLLREGFEPSFFILPAVKSSEQLKSWPHFSRLIKRLASMDGKSRSLSVVALGGGVVGDLTGFAAAVYRRGLPYAQIPTTLTAQVDSAIGGKTGIDLPEGKNLLGSIYQPALVLSDVLVLDSLPERHWNDGFAEIVKYGVIRDPGLFALLEKNSLDAIRRNKRLLEKVIVRCARIKAGVVERDEHDKKGVRMVLNFGHTLGHAIEAASRYSRQYTHGEAVAVGMLLACDIASEMKVLRDAALTQRLEQTLIRYNLPLYYKGVSEESILKAVGYDKKSEAGSNRFILPVALGKTLLVQDVPPSTLRACLQKRRGR